MIKEGILNFYKPKGINSNDCIYMMRRAVGIKKIGHTGTLDPMAEGVLPLCIGSASRITEYLDLDFKTYVCTMQLGWETDTLDATGAVLCDRRKEIEAPDMNTVESALSGFRGQIEQLPPKFSAVWVDGRRLYSYARAGEEVEIPKRRVFVQSIRLLEYKPEELILRFEVCCSKGTYIRSICRDIGELLGTGATMTALVRKQSGVFGVESTYTAEDLKRLEALRNEAYEIEKQIEAAASAAENCENGLKNANEDMADNSDEIEKLKAEWERRKSIHEAAVNELLLPADYPLVHFGSVTVSCENGRKFCSGWHISMRDCSDIKNPEFADENAVAASGLTVKEEYRKAYKIYMKDCSGSQVFLGVAFFSDKYHKLVADKVFYKGFNENI